MYFELTELLTCPRCGPQHGLVLLVEEVRDRRVHGGWLGCPNCRCDYPITRGIADLRVEAESPGKEPDPYQAPELPVKIAALSGIRDGPGYLLLTERVAHAAVAVAELLPDLEVIAIHVTEPQGELERPGVSRILCDACCPVATSRVRSGVLAIAGDASSVAAVARTVSFGGQLVLFDADHDHVGAMEAAGFELIASEGGTAVGRKGGP